MKCIKVTDGKRMVKGTQGVPATLYTFVAVDSVLDKKTVGHDWLEILTKNHYKTDKSKCLQKREDVI